MNVTAATIVNVNPDPRTLEGCLEIRGAFAALDGEMDLSIVHWPEWVAAVAETGENSPLVLGPNDTPFPAYPDAFADLLQAVRRHRGPLLGVCGGHQVLALAHGARVAPVRGALPALVSYEGLPRIEGMVRVRRVADHALWAGMEDEVEVAARHVDEVKDLPAGFELLATSDVCPIQAMYATRSHAVGVQFHPEREASGMAGRTLLSNWLVSWR